MMHAVLQICCRRVLMSSTQDPEYPENPSIFGCTECLFLLVLSSEVCVLSVILCLKLMRLLGLCRPYSLV